VLDLAQPTTPDPAPSRETLTRHALEAINANPQASEAQRLHARSVPLAIRYQATTVRYARLLSTSRADVAEFWEWTRTTMQTGLVGYQDYQPTQRADVQVGDAYEPASVNSVIQTACSNVAIALGGGLDAVETNRPVPGLGMPPPLALPPRRI
jgi:hypothetical protein